MRMAEGESVGSLPLGPVIRERLPYTRVFNRGRSV